MSHLIAQSFLLIQPSTQPTPFFFLQNLFQFRSQWRNFFSGGIGTLLFTTKKLGKYFKHHIPECVFYCIICVRLLPASRAAKTVKPFSITSLSEAIFNPRGDFCNHRGWKRKLWTSIATERNKISSHWQPAALQGWRHQRGGKPGMAGCSSIPSGHRALPVNMSKRLSLK